MQTFFLIILFVFGLLFGSFASVIIYRLKSGEGGILGGRSHCGSCNKLLQAIDLIPLFSWLFNKGKCRQCKAKVSGLYPLLEISTGILFSLIGFFLIDFDLIQVFYIGEIVKLFFWLTIGFISIIYIFYDILFLEISEIVLAAGVGVMTVGIIIQTYTNIIIFPNLPNGFNYSLLEANHSIGLLLIMIAGFYTIILKGLNAYWDTVILFGLYLLLFGFNYFFTNNFYLTDFTAISAIIGALGIFTFFFIQYIIGNILHYLEKKKGIKEKDYRFANGIIGGGDFRIAIMVGLGLGTSLTFPSMMITYFVGSVIGIGFLINQKLSKKEKINNQIAFGPFLAIGFFIAIFFQDYILHFIDLYFFI